MTKKIRNISLLEYNAFFAWIFSFYAAILTLQYWIRCVRLKCCSSVLSRLFWPQKVRGSFITPLWGIVQILMRLWLLSNEICEKHFEVLMDYWQRVLFMCMYSFEYSSIRSQVHYDFTYFCWPLEGLGTSMGGWRLSVYQIRWTGKCVVMLCSWWPTCIIWGKLKKKVYALIWKSLSMNVFGWRYSRLPKHAKMENYTSCQVFCGHSFHILDLLSTPGRYFPLNKLVRLSRVVILMPKPLL